MKLREFFAKLFGRKKKKLGLALGCGGAKGLALIGVLKAFEEENVKFDVVAGSSIGSVVGGMYASGVTPGEMLDYLKEYNLSDPKSLIMLKLKGYTVEKLLSHITGGRHFDELSIPYSAVAGGYVNAVPASVCRKLGADVVIGVNLCSEDYNSAAKAALDKSYKQNGIALIDRVRSGRENSDFFLELDLSGYSGFSISAFDPMYVIGYRSAKAKMPEIINMLVKNKVIKKRGKKQK